MAYEFIMKANELLKRIESKNAPVIIDARSATEFKRGHVPGAINAPPRKILLKTARLPKDKDLEIVVYCGHGPRAMIAKRLLWPSTVIAIWTFSKGIGSYGEMPACLWKSSFGT